MKGGVTRSDIKILSVAIEGRVADILGPTELAEIRADPFPTAMTDQGDLLDRGQYRHPVSRNVFQEDMSDGGFDRWLGCKWHHHLTRVHRAVRVRHSVHENSRPAGSCNARPIQ